MWVFYLSFFGCQQPPPVISCEKLSVAFDDSMGGNVLVILTDDIGIDKTAAYSEHPHPANTPNLDALACAGVLFRNAYSHPTCTPSRSALMTGRYGLRTGLGTWFDVSKDNFDLSLDEVTIPEMLRQSIFGYSSSAVGKWHLGSKKRETVSENPLEHGFGYHAGSLGNPLEAIQPGNVPRGFRNWEKSTNGELSWETTYMTVDTANEALEQIETLEEPWFLYVAFNAAHDPIHVPPKDLFTLWGVHEWSSYERKYHAMIEAVDSEIGRVLAGIPEETLERTTIIYLSDNGSPRQGITDPWSNRRSKGTVYEGGVNIPMIVTGPLVAEKGTETQGLVHFVDVLPSIAQIAEVDVNALHNESNEIVELDGKSFIPYLSNPELETIREYVYTEGFGPNGAPPYKYHKAMIRDEKWKYYYHDPKEGDFREGFYRFEDGAWSEGSNLLEVGGLSVEDMDAYYRLKQQLLQLHEEIEFAH